MDVDLLSRWAFMILLIVVATWAVALTVVVAICGLVDLGRWVAHGMKRVREWLNQPNSIPDVEGPSRWSYEDGGCPLCDAVPVKEVLVEPEAVAPSAPPKRPRKRSAKK